MIRILRRKTFCRRFFFEKHSVEGFSSKNILRRIALTEMFKQKFVRSYGIVPMTLQAIKTLRVWVRHPDFPGERFYYVLLADEGCAKSCLLGVQRYYQCYAEKIIRIQQEIPCEWELYWQDWRETPEGASGFGYLRVIENGKAIRDEELKESLC